MTADEILKTLEESEGFYLEVGEWCISPGVVEDFCAAKYNGPKVDGFKSFFTLQGAIEYALKDGKP